MQLAIEKMRKSKGEEGEGEGEEGGEEEEWEGGRKIEAPLGTGIFLAIPKVNAVAGQARR